MTDLGSVVRRRDPLSLEFDQVLVEPVGCWA
jgi:hypothetical protein